jgi:hypothetical protein
MALIQEANTLWKTPGFPFSISSQVASYWYNTMTQQLSRALRKSL